MRGITNSLKDGLQKYGIDLPLDGRTKAWKEQVKKFKLEELYIQHLKDLVKNAKKKEADKAKRYFNQVIKQNEIEKQRGYNRNKVSNSRRKPLELRSEEVYTYVDDMLNVLGIHYKDAFKMYVIDFKTGAQRDMSFENKRHFGMFWTKEFIVFFCF